MVKASQFRKFDFRKGTDPRLAAVICGLCMPALFLTQTASSFLRSVLFPGGIADSVGEMAYVRSGNEIHAINLSNGTLTWKTARASIPLFIADDDKDIFAIAFSEGKPQVVILNRFTGEVIRVTALDEGVQGSADSFRFNLERVGTIAELTWTIVPQLRGGANLKRLPNEELPSDASFFSRINIISGELEGGTFKTQEHISEIIPPEKVAFANHLYFLRIHEVPPTASDKPGLYLECEDVSQGIERWRYLLGGLTIRKQREQHQ